MVVNRFEVYLVTLDPTVGSEIKKTRPCVVISPNEINHNIATVIIAPLSSVGRLYPSRIGLQFEGKEGLILLDQIRAVDKQRLLRPLGSLTEDQETDVLEALARLFAP